MYIGIDVGTSGTKVALIDSAGNILRSYQRNYSFSNTENGYRELDASTVWNAVVECLNKVGRRMPVRTITVSALGEAIVPIDQNGVPLSMSITGTDVRGGKELEELSEHFGQQSLTHITGLNLSPIYSLNKILWMKRHQAILYEKAWKIMTFQDYIIYRLAGHAVIDYSMASRTLMFDININDWSEAILKKTGIDREKLSTPCSGGSIVGSILPDMAQAMGMSQSVKVVVGTHDHICNAIGGGAVHYGECVNTVGTTEGVTALIRRSQLATEDINKYQISCEPFVLPKMFNTVAWNNTSGVLLRWFAEEFVQKSVTDKRDILGIYRQLNREIKDGPTDLLVLPYFSGAATPHMDEHAKGVIVGLTLNTVRSDIYKALMEGANYELALILECLEKSGLKIQRLISTGGAQSDELLQIKADILGKEIYTLENRQTGTLGGAILGAVAINDFTDLEEAVEKMVKTAGVYEPELRNYERYREKFQLYQELYQKTLSICHSISKMEIRNKDRISGGER